MLPGLLALLAGVYACTGGNRYIPVGRPPQAYYQTALPTRDVSQDLERAFQAVKRIRITAVYDHFGFRPETAPREGERLREELLARAPDTSWDSSSREASAVQIGHRALRATLLANAHAVRFPDTVVEYGPPDRLGRTVGRRPILRVSILRSQGNLLLDRQGILPFRVLATDRARDLALLGVEYPADAPPSAFALLEARPGDARRLAWGSFVYVLGHPAGYPLITRSIVSDPNRTAGGSFLLDGLWNEGISGGPVLAVRGTDESLEWVGIARAAAGRTEYLLAPHPDLAKGEESRLPYDGPIYLEWRQRILYGIALTVPMDAIRPFLDRHRADLERQGWPVPRL